MPTLRELNWDSALEELNVGCLYVGAHSEVEAQRFRLRSQYLASSPALIPIGEPSLKAMKSTRYDAP